MAWRCPDCGRSFGRRGQPHACAPAQSLDAWLAGRAAVVGEVLSAVRSCVSDLGDDVHLEATKGSVMVKRARTFAEVTPRRERADVSFILSRRLDDVRVTRTLDLTAHRIVHVVPVDGARGVDRQLRDWLAEAYRESPQ